MEGNIQRTDDYLPAGQFPADALQRADALQDTQQQWQRFPASTQATGHKEETGSFRPWKVVNWQVENGFVEIGAETSAGGIFLVFWCKEIPLGQTAVPASMLPLSREQFSILASRIIAPAVEYHFQNAGHELWSPLPKEERPPEEMTELSRRFKLARPLEELSRRETAPVPSTLPVSVVVCTRNRPDYLKRCLSSIEALSPKPSEILVVDNDPSSGLTRPVVESFRGTTYIPEARAGLSFARNTGLRHCKGEVIAFTDDDAVVHPRWLGNIWRAFGNEPDVLAVTGLVLPAEIETAAQYVFQTGPLGCEWGFRGLEFGQAFFDFNRRLGVPVWRIGAGANMAFRREAFELAGLFDERLGAGRSGCSEDSEMWYRLLVEGCRCRYDPAAVVFHSHRREWRELRDQAYQYMRGHVAALLFQFDRHRHWGNLRRALLALPLEYAKLALIAARHKAGALLYGSGPESPSCPIPPQIRGVLAGLLFYGGSRGSRGRTSACQNKTIGYNKNRAQKGP